MFEFLHKHLGLRAEGMILQGGIWILFGVRSFTTGPPALVPSVFHLLIPVEITAALWILSGMIAIITAPFRRASDVGLAVLIVQPGLRFFSYTYAWIVEIWPGPPPGDPQGWYLATIYLAMMLWVRHTGRIPAGAKAPLKGALQ